MSSNQSIPIQKRKIYCCNCGKLGHVLRNCIEPIISLGIVLYDFDSENNLRFLLIRRKFSHGFMGFIMGKYSINNLTTIHMMFDEMTIREKLAIISKSFEELWYSIDYNRFDLEKDDLSDDIRKKIETEFEHSKRKFNLIKRGCINRSNQYVNLYQLVKHSMFNWVEQEWEFPKGKRKMNESNLDAALREFNEETDISLDKIDIILTEYPFVEKYVGTNGKKYKHIYYIARANCHIELFHKKFTNEQDIEISNIAWFNFDDAIRAIRPYFIEKKMILNNIRDYILTKNV